MSGIRFCSFIRKHKTTLLLAKGNEKLRVDLGDCEERESERERERERARDREREREKERQREAERGGEVGGHDCLRLVPWDALRKTRVRQMLQILTKM